MSEKPNWLSWANIGDRSFISLPGRHIFVEESNSTYWHGDETEGWICGPYETEDLARQALASYCVYLERGPGVAE